MLKGTPPDTGGHSTCYGSPGGPAIHGGFTSAKAQTERIIGDAR